MLRFLKTIHTLIWLAMTVANFAAFHFAYNNIFDVRFRAPALLLIGESIVVFANRWKCPITNIAEKYTPDRHPNFDIYLPVWLARYNKEIFTLLILLEILIVVIHLS
ncbi:MAG TPA: hypothetical protein VJ579_03140 [Candidatus Paceibacterota bacterium]|nr:hypothetical protein [Candidatus Paceibacterota bacterium]